METKEKTHLDICLEEFVKKLKDTYQEDLKSVILYGSAASGEFLKENSNINLLVILANASLENLGKVAPLINAYKYRFIDPLFFSEEYMVGSLDVFPIEFLDIQENYKVIFGKDVIGYLKIDIKNLRFQCEQELKVKLIKLKNEYLRTRNKIYLRDRLFKSVNSIVHILRNVLRLKGKKPAYQKEDVLNEVSWEFSIDTTNIANILDARRKNLRLNAKKIDELFVGLVRDLEIIIAIIDKL